MIPFIRSLSELMAITESRETQNDHYQNNESYNSTMDSGQRKRYTRSLDKKDIDLLPVERLVPDRRQPILLEQDKPLPDPSNGPSLDARSARNNFPTAEWKWSETEGEGCDEQASARS